MGKKLIFFYLNKKKLIFSPCMKFKRSNTLLIILLAQFYERFVGGGRLSDDSPTSRDYTLPTGGFQQR